MQVTFSLSPTRKSDSGDIVIFRSGAVSERSVRNNIRKRSLFYCIVILFLSLCANSCSLTVKATDFGRK